LFFVEAIKHTCERRASAFSCKWIQWWIRHSFIRVCSFQIFNA